MGYSSEQPSSEAKGKVEQKKNVQGHEPCVFVLCDPPLPVTGSRFTPLALGSVFRFLGKCRAHPQMLSEHNCQGSPGPVSVSSLEPGSLYF